MNSLPYGPGVKNRESLFPIVQLPSLWGSMSSARVCVEEYINSKGAFVWDQSGIRIIGIMQVSVCLGAILIPEYLDFHSYNISHGAILR